MMKRDDGVRQVNISSFLGDDASSNLGSSHQSPIFGTKPPAKFLKPNEPIINKVGELLYEVVEGKRLHFVKRILQRFHYLPRHDLVGRQIFIKVTDMSTLRCVSVLAFSNPIALNLGDRDKWIGWDKEQRLRNLNHKIMHEARFLILPHVQIPNLASQILSKSCRVARRAWKDKYGDNAVLVESFVDSRYYEGTCYKAANFKYLGKTKGFSSMRTGKRTSMWASQLHGENTKRSYQTLQPIGFPKLMYYLPLHRHWRRELLK